MAPNALPSGCARPVLRRPAAFRHPVRQLPVILLVVLLAAPAAAQTKVIAEHPRLFLRAAGVAALRERCRSDAVTKQAYASVRKFAYSRSVNSNLWVAPDELSTVLVAYLVEDRDPKLLDRARGYIDIFHKARGDSWTRPRMLKALAQAYDWLHDDLSEAERKRLAARMAELVAQMRKEYRHSDYNNHVYLEYGPILYAGLALAGDGVDDALARNLLAEAGPLLKGHFIPAINQVSAGGAGGWHESMSYWSFFAYELAHQLEAWRTATGEDLLQACPGLRGAPDWLVWCTRPHDGSMAPLADINTPAPWGWQERAYMPLLAARYGDGLAQHVASQVPIKYACRAWPLVLWHDPAVKPIRPASLPTGTLFPGVGWAAMRGSWEKDAVWALFVCGDYYAGHQHSDQNSFVIARGGYQAIDAGEYGAKATEFHNTVLIGDGQRLYRTDPRQQFAPTAKGSEFDTGEILAFEEHGLFSYVVGDASNAYGAFRGGRRVEPAPRFVRRFLFVRPELFIVDDLVRAPSPKTPVRWLLHSRNEPNIAGRTVTITDGPMLTCETLLPEKAAIEVTPQTGGKKNETFWRIDVAPEGRAAEVRFLHVLRSQFAGAKIRTGCELERSEGEVQLTVTHGDRVVRLWLPDSPDAAGEIKIAAADGKTLLERRPLAAGVLPFGRTGPRLLERWDAAYRRTGPAPWDTGRPSSDLKKAVEDGTLRPCRAVELGCGSGTNAIYLAGKGFDVTAIDIAPTALAMARQKADKAGVKVRWLLADVLHPPELPPFDLVYDRGCYHGVRGSNAAGYVAAVEQLTKPGSGVLILAGSANEERRSGPPRVTEEELRGDFSRSFDFQWLRETHFDTMDAKRQGALAWSVLLRRKAEQKQQDRPR